MLDKTDSNCFLTTFLKFESFFTNQEQQLNKSDHFAGIFQNVSFPAKFYELFPAPSEFISLKDFCEETSYYCTQGKFSVFIWSPNLITSSEHLNCFLQNFPVLSKLACRSRFPNGRLYRHKILT